MAKKNRWSPMSTVNQNHLAGMIAKGDSDYHNWLGRVFTAGTGAEFEATILEGEETGYLNEDGVTLLLGTGPSTAAIEEAAASAASDALIYGLANAQQHGAVKALIAGGTVSGPQVATVYESLGMDFEALTAPAKPAAKSKK